MDSICFYQPAPTRTAFSNKVTRSCDPFAFVPTGRGSQHTKWSDALERVEVVEVMGLTVSDEGGPILKQQPVRDGSERIQGHFKLEALKADRLEHGAEDDRHDRHSSDDDNDDDDELPPLSDLLHEWRRERSAEMAPLSPTQCMMTEQLLDGSGLEGGLGMADAGAKIATLKPGDKPENLIELDDDDDLHATTPDSDYGSLGRTLLGSSFSAAASSCDLSGEITLGGQHIDAAPADGVPTIVSRKDVLQGRISMITRAQPRPVPHHSTSRPLPVSKPAAHASNYNTLEQVPPASAGNIYDIFAEYDSFSRKTQTRQASRGRQQRSSSSCLSQSRLGRSIASVDGTMLSPSKAGEPSTTRNDVSCRRHRQHGLQVSSTELHSEELYPEPDDHCERPDNGLGSGRAPSTSSRGSSALHPSPPSVKDSLENGNIERRQSSVWTGSKDLAPSIATRRDRNNGTDLVSPLRQEVRNRSASSSGNATLPDVGPSQQRSLRPRKRSREAERSIAYLGGTAPPALTPSSQARNSMKDYSSNTGDTPPALGGREICVGDYITVRCEDDGEGAVQSPEIAKVERINSNGQLGMLWAYHPVHQHVPKDLKFGPYELLLSDHRDTVRVECLMGYVEVEENCKNCEHATHWCWNKRYKAKERKVISSSWTAKRRRVDG